MDIVLDGEWRLYFFPQGTLPLALPCDVKTSGVDNVPARVPGNVELDLVRAGVLPEPFVGENIQMLRALEFNEWWYTREFEVPASWAGQRVELVFEGLDTVATVWLNDCEVGRADNMLVAHRFDVSEAVRPGENRICVRIASALLEATAYPYEAPTLSWETREEGVYLRKAPHVWGWDIMPRAVSAGIWRSVRLETVPEHSIEQMYYWTASASEGHATLGAHFGVRTSRFTPNAQLNLRITGVCGNHRFEHVWPLEFLAGNTRVEIPGARLWWPKGYGEANLYDVTAQLRDGSEVLAERRDRIGLRALELIRTDTAGPAWSPGPAGCDVARMDTPPDPSAQFLFRVNGVPIMIKGSNWVPLDAFHSRDLDRVDEAVGLADDLGCTMLRCWGGNVYESDRFFDLCDERGILVWQDFALACCRYPQDDAFLNRVRAEAESVMTRLRNHASLAVWCGDNEIDGCYAWDGIPPESNRITREVLPRVAHRFDPRRPYVPSSPYIAPNAGWNMPEQHLWGPRGYFKGPYYTHHNAAFIGEIGYHGCPNVSSIKRFITPGRLWPYHDNDEWRAHDVTHSIHQEDRNRVKLMANQIREVFGEIPDTLDTFALASQIVQAEAKKFFVESTRARKWRTSGILWWNVIDGWPQFSDAIVDYYFGKKLAYHYIRRAQASIGLCIGEAGSEKYRPLLLCNDTRTASEVAYRVWDADTREVVAQGTAMSPANENWQIARLRAFAGDVRLYLMEWTVNGQRFGNHYLAGTPPFSLDRYRAWLPLIAALERPFDAEKVAL